MSTDPRKDEARAEAEAIAAKKRSAALKFLKTEAISTTPSDIVRIMDRSHNKVASKQAQYIAL